MQHIKKNPVKDLESDHPDHPSYLIGHLDHSGPVESSSNRASTSQISHSLGVKSQSDGFLT